MILKLTLEQDKATGKILQSASHYDPSQAVKDRTLMVMNDWMAADNLRNKPYEEFNWTSLIDRINQDKMSWNQFTGEQSDDPAQAWRSTAFRPIVRNKIIAICAQLTASIIYPQIYAQNDQDQEDKDAATVMRDILEWVQENYDYDKTFIGAVIDALVLPATFVHQEYCEKMRTIKEITGKGKWKTKEVLDELFSGFRSKVVPCDEMWISDFYTHDIQKQPYLVWRRVMPYVTAKAMYGDRDDFSFVRPGVQFLFSGDQNLFYEVYDESMSGELVEVAIYYNREADLELLFINGILLTDVNQPNPRQDKKYPFTKAGFELIDGGRFFYYKSLAFKALPDELVVNTLYRMMIDGTYLQIMPPAVVFGDEVVNAQVIVPGMVTTISDPNPQAAFQTINTNNNLQSAFSMIEKVEASISESTTDALLQGQAAGSPQTAFEISRLEENSKVMLGLFAKMIGFLVKDLGELIISDILQFATVGEVMETSNESNRMKFASFLLPEKTIDGKTKTRKIDFDMELPDEMTEDEEMGMSLDVYKEEQKYSDDTQIMKVNPSLFRKLKFRVVVKPEAVTPKSDLLKKAMNLELYGLAIANPLSNQESITRDALFGSFDLTKDDPEKYMKKEEEMMAEAEMGAPGAQKQPSTGGLMKSALGSEIPS